MNSNRGIAKTIPMEESTLTGQEMLSNLGLICVIITTYRRPQLLKRAIDSVLAQTYPHFQIRIYDVASQDETKQVVAQYRDERIHYHEHYENIGLNNNYNYALNRVDTPFCVFLSDDDLFMPTFLEESMKGFLQYPEAGLFFGGVIFIDTKNRLVGATTCECITHTYYSPKDIIQERVRNRFPSSINALVFRREVRDEIGLFNEKQWLDIEFVLKAQLQFSAILSPSFCVVYQYHSNYSNNTDLNEYWNMLLTVKNAIVNSVLISDKEKCSIEQLMHCDLKTSMTGMIYHKFVTLCFSESLKGIAILQQHYSLNKMEIIINFFSKTFLKNKFLVYLFAAVLKIWRSFMRFFHFRRLKKNLGNENYQAFRNVISKI